MIICMIIFLIFILLSVAFYTLFERKIMGINQLRVGPLKLIYLGLAQPLIDGFKLFLKMINHPHKSVYVFFLSPTLSFSIMCLLWMSFYSFNFKYKIFYLLILFGISVYSFVLSGWSSFSKFGYLGGLRASSQTISYEISLTIIFLILIFFMKNLSFYFMVELLLFINLLPIFLIWLITMLAETNRAPFDFSEGESELISGFNVEYGSGGFVLFFLAEYSMMIFFCLISCNLFNMNIFFFLFLLFFFIIMRTSFPRFRYDFLIYLFWMKILPFSIIFLIITMIL